MKTNLLKNIIVILCVNFFSSGIASALDRIIIKYKTDTTTQTQYSTGTINKSQLNQILRKPLSINKLDTISKTSGLLAQEINQTADGGHVIKLNSNISENNLNTIVNELKAESNVEYAEVDILLQPTAVPVYNPVQWDMLADSTGAYGSATGDNFLGLQTTWNSIYPTLNPGSNIVVAVMDTGYTPHPAFLNNLVPHVGTCTSLNGTAGAQCYGYQFISDCRLAGSCPSSQTNNVSLDPKADGLDLGDFITTADANTSFFSGCGVYSSSWHGSHVTGTIVANNSNGTSGMLGGAYGAKVLPLRVLGKCGGYISDIINAIYYAVNDYPDLTNPNPAKVINMSFGGYGACSSYASLQRAIDNATSRGAIVVVAAGNSGDDIANYLPAGCNNVISVAAKSKDNSLAWYSNYGNTTITAAGGGEYFTSITNTSEVYSSLWNSTNAYNYSNGEKYGYYEGTSMATPHVSAVVADLIGFLLLQNQSYSYNRIMNILQTTASMNYSGGASNWYGSVTTGMLDAGNALSYTINNYTNTLTPSTSNVSLVANSTYTITFTNNQSNLVSVANVVLTGLDSVTISSDDCINATLLNNHSCSVSIASNLINSNVSRTTNEETGTLALVDSDGNVISSLIVTYTFTNSGNSTAVSSDNNGGGCAMIQHGDDYSLILILMVLSLVYLKKRLFS